MHLIVRDSASLDEIGEPRDLGLGPADFVLLSFSDSDLRTFGAAKRGALSAHFINLALLRHPISADLFIDKAALGTKAILLRLLGGLDYWRYGAEELAYACRKHNVALAVLPGDGRADPRLPPLSTVDSAGLEALERLLSAGGAANAGLVMSALTAPANGAGSLPIPAPVASRPEFGIYRRAKRHGGGSAAVVFYRSFLQAGDVEPVDALFEALLGENGPSDGAAGKAERTLSAYYVPSLKDPAAAAFLRDEFERCPPDVIVNTTAFSARADEARSPLDEAGCPVLQAAMAGSAEEAWRASPRGLSAADLAMHVVLPELDGRLFAGAISFKARDTSGAIHHSPYAAGIDHTARLASAWARLRTTPPGARKLALVLSTYPGRPDQIAHAVGLDGPKSALRIAQALQEAGYATAGLPSNPAGLLEPFLNPDAAAFQSWTLADYRAAFARLPFALREAVVAAWGEPETDPAFARGYIKLPLVRYGHLLIGLQAERGFLTDRKSGYHDPNLPPRHAYIAFYLWLRECAAIDALIHLGAHGTLEWLPGKAVALSEACTPRALLGSVPVVYPFIVNDPGEAAQAKRRISAITIGHNTPPLTGAAPSPALSETERLLDEYSAADGLDKGRRDRLARDILGAAKRAGIEEACGIRPDMTESEALMRVDGFLCDVKVLAIRDGLHVLDENELDAILRALDGRFIEPGPSGAPSRGRADVLPAGRNLYTIDPRTIPTPLACENGARAADAIIARYAEDRGDWPRSMVLDLWGSQTVRTGGEEIGTALALLGVKPVWDYGSSRVTGFEIIPLMKLNRPRVDVTLRISGLMRDMFPALLAFFHAAVQRVAALNEPQNDNPLARRGRREIYRIFGAAGGAYGAGVSARIDAGDWQTRSDLAEAYLAASATAYAGEGEGVPARSDFEACVRAADGFVHIQDHRETDILSSLDFAAHEGGFAAAASALGNAGAALYHADSGEPESPRVRTLSEEAARVLHGRALSGRWLEGQMRHSFAGAAGMAATVDSAYALAATSGAISSEGIEQLYEAYLGDPAVAAFLAAENGAALAAMQNRFRDAIARSLWTPRRNDLSGLDAGGAA